ncbi:uncharacterized protein EAE97_005769 [Botrytis byssoidea]|uniref:SprT-like domain-containing protein n=1 Tax=Botrytis byssoidea TaxID=139641 RepID=A0A9P5IQV3_9HELO|nr:uncharacterized protein EAE97_005769 [Botrytis byssoidea]KAF7943699.1 hypothetical protein EAE97_005769 [Botrytis byssoidea]
MTIHECHLNPYAARRILWAGDRAHIPLQPLCCTYSQAADLIADNIANALHGPTGQPLHDPFYKIKENWRRSNLSDLAAVIKNPWLKGKKEQDLLDLYFSYFNAMIFGGALNTMRCVMKLEEPNAEQKARNVLGTTVDKRGEKTTTRHNVRCYISVFVRSPPPENEEESKILLENYLGTMLHEMVHAFFSIYVCKCNTSCRRKVLEFEESGMTGHGMQWQRAARSVESFARQGLRLDVRLGREEALGLELVIADKEIWYVDLEKMGMDREVVDREMDWFAHVFMEELEERKMIEKEKEDRLEKLELERVEREEEEELAKEEWERERPEREAKERQLLKNHRARIHESLRGMSSRANGKIFKRITNPVRKHLATSTSRLDGEDATASSQSSLPNFLLARRTHFATENVRISPATNKYLQNLKSRHAYPYIQKTVNPNIPSINAKYKIGMEVSKPTYENRERNTKKMERSGMAPVKILDLENFWNLHECAEEVYRVRYY